MSDPSPPPSQPNSSPLMPQSNLLAEAQPDSLGDVMSMDPETWTPSHRARVIAEYRRQREAWAKAEASGATRAPSAKKIAGPKITETPKTAGDLGL